MATVTPSQPTPRLLAESQQRIRHPLQRLRGFIRGYVSLEGAIVLVLYLALWFWIGLALDYGFFKLFATDWVQELPWSFRLGPWLFPWVRTVTLLLLVAGLLTVVAAKVLFRLLTDFRDAALALVLERRFPQLFGDRLITAIELADVRKAARYGYSREMIEQTIVDAAERVDRVPLSEVFNWRRLVLRGIVLGVMIVGVYLLSGIGSCTVDLFLEHRASLAGFGRLHETSRIWAERNLLLRDVLWPRRAFLQVVGFPESGEMRIGQDSPPPTLRARALKWIVADSQVADKWRALTWQDLVNHTQLLGGAGPPALPEAWLAERSDWTIDQVELQLNKLEADRLRAVQLVLEKLDHFMNAPDSRVRRNPPAAEGQAQEAKWLYADDPTRGKWRSLTWQDVKGMAEQIVGSDEALPDLPDGWAPAGGSVTVDEIETKLGKAEATKLALLQSDLLDRLEQTSASRRYRDSFRKVIVPEKVFILARGASSYNTITMQKTGDNEYTGTLADLKESVRFTIRGEDYYTPSRLITVVPPPSVVSITRDEYRPAYLYYRIPAGSTANELKTSKQAFLASLSSVSGGDTTRIQLPAGTDLVLTAKVDKPLRRKSEEENVEDGVRILPPRKGVAEVKAKAQLLDDTTFQTRFDDIRKPLDFVFEFTDTDNVIGLRHVFIKPLEDAAPEVDAQVEVVRKTNQGFMVTPFALVPFSGKVRDDHGLAEVNYVCTLTRLDSQAEAGGKALVVLGALYQLGGGFGQDLLATAQLAALAKVNENQSAEAERLPIAAFVEGLQERTPREVLPRSVFLKLLPQSGDRDAQVPLPSDPTRTVTAPHPISLRTLFSEFTLEPEKAPTSFDLLKLTRGPKIATEREIQPRYRMQIWVEAVDNDVLTGPHRSQSKEKFTFVVVSANELLSEIAKEEESLHVKLDDMTGRLKESRGKLDQVVGDLGAPGVKPEQFAPMSVRAEEIEQVREKAETASQEVWNDYQRILKEMDLNRVQRVQPNIMSRVERTISNPLDEILHGEFPRAREGLDELRKVLDNKELATDAKAIQARTAATEARNRLDALIRRLDEVLNSMEGLTSVNTLIKKLRDLEESERAQYEVLERLKKEIEKNIFDKLFGDDKPRHK